MKRKRLIPRPDRWTGFAVLAGLVWAMAFPPLSLAGLGWVTPLLLVAPGLAVSPGRAFRLGWLAGFVHHLATLAWLLWNPFPVGAAAGWIALSAFLALYPAIWVALCRRLLSTPATATADAPPAPGQWPAGWEALAGLGWARRLGWCPLAAVLWVALEMAQARVLTGFPWNFLGVSQVKHLPLIQIAAVTGVYGVSFVVAWFGVALAAAATVFRRPGLRAARANVTSGGAASPRHLGDLGTALGRELLPPLGVVLALVFDGGMQIRNDSASPTGRLKIALVQPAIPQRLIFDPAEATTRFEQLMELTELALATDPDLLVWPEAALPAVSREQYVRLAERIRQGRAWMVLGGDDARPNPENPEDYDWFNAAFLLSPGQGVEAVYHKQRLVIFGEYVPLTDWFPWLGWLTPVTTNLRPGPGPVAFRLKPFGAVASVLICFEDTFGRLARHHATAETDFLLNLTNDAWFGETAAQWQHLATATFRAVENGLPLVRCANNGISGWVTRHGAWRDLAFGPGTRVYDRGFKIVELRLGQSPRKLTFYTRHGDVFGWSCVGIGLLAVVWSELTRWRSRGRRNVNPPG